MSAPLKYPQELRDLADTVAAALASTGPPKYERAAAGSAVDAFEPAIRELLARRPVMPATVIAERVGWQRGMSVFTARMRDLSPYYLPPDPSSRTTYQPGERMQCDMWFPPAPISLGAGQIDSPPVLVMTAGYSRVIGAVMIPTRAAPDLIAGHWHLLQQFGLSRGSWFAIRRERSGSGGAASQS